MAKKINPQQEQPAEEEQQETEAPEEETAAQEEQPQAQDTPEQEEPEEQEPEENEPEEAPREEQPQEQQSDAPAQEQPADESADLRRRLLEAHGQIAAYAAGVAPDMVEDAVTLAMAEATKTGEVTEEAVNKAMDVVLKRHPEWKASGAGKPKGGFRLGADRDNGGSGKPSGNTNQNVKRWNRFK